MTQTDRDLAILVDFIEGHGYAPSIREMLKMFGVSSTATVHGRLKRLVDDGRITRVGPRAIEIHKGEPT